MQPNRELKKLIADLKSEGRIVKAKSDRPRIHPAATIPPEGSPPASGGATQAAYVWDRLRTIKGRSGGT